MVRSYDLVTTNRNPLFVIGFIYCCYNAWILEDKTQGVWETLDMVVRYTKSVKFEDGLQLYQEAIKG
jgi:hypothetical protein